MGHKRRRERKRRHENGDFEQNPTHVARVISERIAAQKAAQPKPRWVKPEHPIARRRRLRAEQALRDEARSMAFAN